MFHLYSSNRTERLTEQMAAILDQSAAVSLFEPALILVQSRGMERMLAHRLADRFGVWCSGRFLLPARFVDQLGERLGVAATGAPFTRDLLVWRLERLLRDSDEPVRQPLRSYLTGTRAELKRYQLAFRLANVFDQYQIMRPDLLRDWEQGGLVGLDESEAWQRDLWLALRREQPAVPHRGEVIEHLIGALRSGVGTENLPQQVFVFGIHTMPPLFLGILEALAHWSEVHFFLPAPCRQYWGDMESPRRRSRRGIGSSAVDDHYAVPAGAYHPLLAGLGRQGAHFQELLLEMIEEVADGPDLFEDPLVSGAPSLLRRLQADLLDARPLPQTPCPTPAAADDSLVIVSCHSRFREVMVLKDHLLARLDADPGLQLHDVVVMAPDMEVYAPYIPAVFQQIPHDICDSRLHRENRLVDGFLQFLQLFSGRYGWRELFGLLERPEISSRFGLGPGDLEAIRRWIVDSGIRWGLSAEQRRQDGFHPFAPATWRYGLERLLMGVAVDSDQPVLGVLPCAAVEGGQGELLGGLCRFVELVEQAAELFRVPTSLEEWGKRLRFWGEALFAGDLEAELLALLTLFTGLEQRFSAHHREPVSGEVIRAWLASEAQTRSSANFLSGRLMFCSLLPMRSVPFKQICLLGLNDNEFPRPDRFSSFDLLGLSYRPGDRSRRSDDRYQFLEAVTAARDGLYLSYVGQSIRTNKEIPPSVVVTELVEVLRHGYGVADVVRRQPLQPYDRNYFSGGDDRLFSYDEEQFRLAVALEENGPATALPWLVGVVPTPLPESIRLDDLLRFFKSPQRYLVEVVFGLRLGQADEQVAEHEPFALAGLERYRGQQVLVEAMVRRQADESLLPALQDRQLWPLGALGRQQFTERTAEIRSFVAGLRQAGIEQPQEPLPFSLDLERLRLEGVLRHRYGDGILLYRYGRLRGSDILVAWALHLVAGQVLAGPVSTRLVTQDQTLVVGASRGSRHDLEILIDLFLDGHGSPSRLLVEPAWAYARQVISNRGRGRKDPLAAARDALMEQLNRGFDPALAFLYRDRPLDEVLDERFVQLCEQLLVPLAILVDNGGGEYD